MRSAEVLGIVVSLVLSAGVRPASAQAFGVKGGANVSTIAVSPADGLGDVSGKAGVVGGAFLTFHDTSRLSFEVAGQLVQRRFAFAPDVGEPANIRDTVTYVEAPVVVRWSLFGRPTMTVRGVGGVSLGFRVRATESLDGDSFSATDAYKPLDIALVVGAQAEWKNRWLVEGRYQFGVSDVYDVTIGGMKTRQRGLQILAGYRFR
jgi:hypothetical protein